jgi:class 3 adenylate cyclase/predicted ATPase
MSATVQGACAACGADLPPDARFCVACGAPTGPVPCPSCGSPLTPGARFCASCGASVSGETVETPPAPTGPIAERRVTSVLFGDLVGFTPLSEGRDAEDVRELLSAYFERCRVIVSRYGGVIEKFIGDAVMAVWGVPVAHEDDAERAVRAGLELVQAVAAMGAEVGAPGLAMRVGIVTGEVAVNMAIEIEGMVAGDAVNTAARVQSVAEPGHVWVDGTTRSLAAAAITFEDRGEHELKGKAAPMRLFAAGDVVGELGGSRIDGLEAPLVSRDRELRTLKELFHATEESHRPRLVVLDGEAGIGKSRLGWEFEKYIDGLATAVAWHRGRCLSYGDGVAFWALAEALRPRLGLLEVDTGDTVEERLDRHLEALVEDPDERKWIRPRLAALLGIETDGTYARDDLFAAWTAFLEHVGDPVILVIDDAHYADDGLLDFLEHLLSSAHSAIFVLAIARPELVARRPELGGRRASIVRLAALDDDSMARLIDGLVDGLPARARAALVERADGVPLFAVETVRALIDRDVVIPHEGRYVLADPATFDLESIGAPVTLHALVAARLDALTQDERRMVTQASVLGSSFTREALLWMEESSGNRDIDSFDAGLASLQRKEILSVQLDRYSSERGQFKFVQAVVKQVAYSTQSKRDRKARHLAAAEYLAGLPDEGGDLSVVIAQHLLDAIDSSSMGDSDGPELARDAVGLLEKAAVRASALGAPMEAFRHLESARKRVDDPSDQARLKLMAAAEANDAGQYAAAESLAREAAVYYDATDQRIEAGRAVGLQCSALMSLQDNATAIALCEARWDSLNGTRGAEKALLRLAGTLASAHSNRGDMDRAAYFAERRLVLAEALNDASALSSAHVILGMRYASMGAPLTARAMFLSAAEVARENNLLTERATALVTVGVTETNRDLDAAMSTIREALDTARRSGSDTFTAYASGNLSLLLWVSGQLDELESFLNEVLEDTMLPAMRLSMTCISAWLADARGHVLPSLAETTLSDAEPDRAWTGNLDLVHALAAGDLTAARRIAEETIGPLLSSLGLEDDFMHLWPPLVLAALAAHDLELADRLMQPVANAPEGAVPPAVRAQFLRLRGLIGAARGNDVMAVEADLRAGAEALADFGAVVHAGRAYEELGRWLAASGRPDEAESALTEARATYEQIGAAAWLLQLDTLDRV